MQETANKQAGSLVKEQSPMATSLSALAEHISVLHENIGILEKNLIPVSSPRPESEKSSAEEAMPNCSPYQRELYNAIERVVLARKRIQSIVDGLEV